MVRALRRNHHVARKVLRVPLEVRPALLENRREPVELRDAERAEDVAEAVVVSDLFVLVPRALLARLLRALLRALGEAAVVGHYRAAAGSRDDLVSVEGVDSGESGGTGALTLPRRADSLRRVVDEDGAVSAAQLRDRAVVAARAV